jgi:predicted NBD/HSP70 family sugar kinase
MRSVTILPTGEREMELRGTNQESGRPFNRRIVLETIRLHEPISRGEIARRVGLTIQTVSTITRELEALGFVRSTRGPRHGRGHPAAMLRLNPEGGFAIGLHVTPIGVEAALIDLAGTLVDRRTRALAPTDPEEAFVLCAELVAGLRAVRSGGRMLGIGVAIPGPVGVEAMSFVGSTTLEGWKDVAVAERIEGATGLPTFVGIDLAAAALGERLYGAGRELGDFYYLYFGVGLGGAMVHDGVVLRGAHGNAGEIGHLPLDPVGELCPCGNRGCLERTLSLDALDRRLKAAGLVRDRAIAEGAPAFADWLAEAAPLLRRAAVTIENLFDPQTILIGGLAPDALIERLVAAAEPLPPSVAERRDRTAPRLTLSRGGSDAVLRGAAALAVSGLLSPRLGTLFAGEERAEPGPSAVGRSREYAT